MAMLRWATLMFYEKQVGTVTFFRFSELEEIAGLFHAFTSRPTDEACGLSNDARSALDKTPLLERLGLPTASLVQLRQVHSNRIVRRPGPPSRRTRADGIVLDGPGRLAAVRTADCLPGLVIDAGRRRLVAVHAGWRGTLGRILGEAIQELTATGSRPADLIAALGPCIRSCCYEVGEDFPDRFAREGHDVDRIFRGRHLNLPEANRAQAEAAGVERILDSRVCTCCSGDAFYSYRRAGDAGRMWALAGFLG